MNTYSRKILITGGNGQLAQSLHHHAMAHEFATTFCPRSELDITQPATIKAAIDKYQPDIIVNTAAYTAVDKAEQEIDAAMMINHHGTQNIAAACKKAGIPLIHISTDYVFDGCSNTAYMEDDPINPIGVYGKSKWLGEVAVREQGEQHTILRVSGVFSEYGNNFLLTMLRLAQERPELRIVADQMTCPTYAGDIANVIYQLAKNPKHLGTFHFCNQPATSWHAFATAIIGAAKKYQKLTVENIHAITTAEYPTAAKRPAFSVLNCDKIAKQYSIIQPHWDVAIHKIASDIKGR